MAPRSWWMEGVRPGLVVVALATVASFAVACAVPSLNPTTAAVLLGSLLVNLGLDRPVFAAGLAFASKQLLRIAVVLLGLQLSLGELVRVGAGGLVVVLITVIVTFIGAQQLGRAFRIPPAQGLLIATGFSICGASAVAAMEPVAGGNKDDTSVAIALVTLCGGLAIFVLPPLQAPLGLDATAFGSWVGASVHDVGQTVATASRVPGALDMAVVTKLTRVVLLAPLIAIVVYSQHRHTVSEAIARPPVMPLFVAGFLGSVVIASTGLLPPAVIGASAQLQAVLLTAALVGLGTGIRLALLRRTGGRPLALGLLSWVLVAAVAYAGVLIIGS